MTTRQKQLNFELIPTDVLADTVIADIDSAKSEVYLRTMGFDAEDQMGPIVDALARAAGRAVPTTLVYDPISHYSRHRRAAARALAELDRAGVAIVTVGRPLRWYLPHAGRSHSKGYLIDDIAYIGGVNLAGESFGMHDYMLRAADATVTKRLKSILRDSETPDIQDDQTIKLDHLNTIYVDGGRRNTSIIMERASDLLLVAARAWYVSQLAPGRKLAKKLAPLDDKAVIKYNTPSTNRSLSGRIASVVEATTVKSIHNTYSGQQKTHAKLLVIQRANGQYVAYTGSHNLSDWGVRLGTKEIMLETHDQQLCRQLIDYAENIVV